MGGAETGEIGDDLGDIFVGDDRCKFFEEGKIDIEIWIFEAFEFLLIVFEIGFDGVLDKLVLRHSWSSILG
ncbi:MAG: hypothetical protein LH649_04810 [Pseudanabaena sp. CAN_BIN31]|nr:hypothetical protein [Pseudanabaena sp. CAN_BIN31]